MLNPIVQILCPMICRTQNVNVLCSGSIIDTDFFYFLFLFFLRCLFISQVSKLCIFGDSASVSGGITHGKFWFKFITITLCHFVFIRFTKHFFFFPVIIKAGLGLSDTVAWYMIETIAEKNNIGSKQFVSFFILFLFLFIFSTWWLWLGNRDAKYNILLESIPLICRGNSRKRSAGIVIFSLQFKRLFFQFSNKIMFLIWMIVYVPADYK